MSACVLAWALAGASAPRVRGRTARGRTARVKSKSWARAQRRASRVCNHAMHARRLYAQVVNHKGRVHDQRLDNKGRLSFVSPHNGALPHARARTHARTHARWGEVRARGRRGRGERGGQWVRACVRARAHVHACGSGEAKHNVVAGESAGLGGVD